MATKRKEAKGKKVVNQEELRRLMRERQRGAERSKKRVESPFAKYSGAGQLSCVLCGVPVKSELLWQTHVLGKQHKDKVAEVKGEGRPAAKRAAPPAAPSVAGPERKKAKAAGVLGGMYDDDDDDDDDGGGGDGPAPALPADFFDSGVPPSVSHSGSVSKAGEEEQEPEQKKENTAEALPEGFFDDPVRDAKVRNVDTPKDLMDKEWEEFQKEMRQVNSASDAIVAEDDEEGRLERQIDEIDQQIECYRRVETLRDKREARARPAARVAEETGADPAEEDEEEEEELLHLLSRDWRAKGALA
uniref:Zinc finger protein 830 n=2 Tax=Denticeps clupeoides TaxID=299321 RepID=A0AAY4A1Q6_9TELE